MAAAMAASVQVPPMDQWDLPAFAQATQAWLQLHSSELNENGQPKFTDVPGVLGNVYKIDTGNVLLQQLSSSLKELEQQCLKAIKAKPAVKNLVYIAAVPASAADETDASLGESELHKHNVRIWQMGFEEKFSFKGASSLFAVLEVVKVNLFGTGNQTQKYPIEILFDCGQSLPVPGSAVSDFSIGYGNGCAVVLGSVLCCCAAVTGGWMRPDSLVEPRLKADLGSRLLKCIRLAATYNPKADLKSQLQSILGTKIQASNRLRPTTLQMLFAFTRLVAAELLGTRKSKAQVLSEVLGDYNRRELVRSLKINSDEVTAIKFLSERSEEFRSLVKLMWGVERPVYTALPMNVLAAEYLQEAALLPVSDT